MGQYYKAIILKEGKRSEQIKCFAESWSLNSGSKLMEHSWIGNEFVGAIEKYLYRNPQRLVWAGDYADEKMGCKVNRYSATDGKESTIKDCEGFEELVEGCYVINHTKNQYYLRPKDEDENGEWQINPLPLLTCEGNGRGCGDYHGTEMDAVGSWRGDVIEYREELSDYEKKNYIDIKPSFKEEW